MNQTRNRLALLAVGLLVATGLAGCVRGESYEFKGGEFDPAAAAGPIDLTDQFGEEFTLDRIDGEISLIYFGYTTCPDLCPTTLSDFIAVKDTLGDDADDVNFIMVTVDPERDTAERLQEYLGFFDPEFLGLRGDNEQTETVKSEYGVISEKVEYPDSATGYLVDHTSFIYVIDQDRNLRLQYPYGFDPDAIAEDIEHLL